MQQCNNSYYESDYKLNRTSCALIIKKRKKPYYGDPIGKTQHGTR